MKRIWIVRIIVIVVLFVSIIIGYRVWINHNDEKQLMEDALIRAEWSIPLGTNSLPNDEMTESEEILKVYGLTIYSDKNPEYKKESKFSLSKLIKFEPRMISQIHDFLEPNYDNEKLYGIKDQQGETIIPAEYNNIILDEEEKYILAEEYQTPKTHYYNLDGSDFIKGDFNSAGLFENGYACATRNGEKIIINTAGERINKIDCEEIYCLDSERKLFVFKRSKDIKESKNEWNSRDNRGVMDIKGNIILKEEYINIEESLDSQNGIMVEYKNGNFVSSMYLDKDFNPKTGKEYDEACQYRKGFALVNSNGEWHIINEHEEVTATITNCIDVYSVAEGIAVVRYPNRVGYLNTEGEELFSATLKPHDEMADNSYQYNEGYIVFKGENGKAGYLDKKGNIVVKPVFDSAGYVNNGKAYVIYGNKIGQIKFD